jgi:YHS domain-containing protein
MLVTMEDIVRRGYSDDKEAIRKRLRRIEGQVRAYSGRSSTLLLGLHDLPQHRLSRAVCGPLLGVPEQGQLGGDDGYALDLVCGMQVEVANAPASTLQAGESFYFCSDRCRVRFEADPKRFAAETGKPGGPVESVSVPVSFGRSTRQQDGKNN